MIKKFYTGIGSRNAPFWALEVAKSLAVELVSYGYTLRSGAAEGMDTAFETGCDLVNGNKEIYLPWNKFNGHPSNLYKHDETARSIAKDLHPAWDKLSQGAKKMHTRNVYQIIGSDYQHPSRFVVCYSNNGRGGTMQAVRLANHMGIPVIDLCLEGYGGSLWDTKTKDGRYEIVHSVLKQVLVKKHILRHRYKPPKRFIHHFRGQYSCFSNFYYAEYILNGKRYYTVENGFQSYKTDPPDERIRVAGSPATAKKLGQVVQLRSDWEEIKDDVMYQHVKAKFKQNNDIRQVLIGTRNAILSEDNTWHDNYWGDCTCDDCTIIKGENKLGKILMRVREELKEQGFY